MLQPAFAPTHLKNATQVTADVSDTLFARSWMKLCQDGPVTVDIHKHFSCLSMDVIGKVAFSHNFYFTDNVHDFKNSIYSVFKDFEILVGAIARRQVPYPIWFVRGIAPSQIKSSTDNVQNAIQNVINEKKEILKTQTAAERAGSNLKMDVLDRLMEYAYDQSDKSKDAPFTDEELRDEVFAFFLAGHETTANTLTFIALELDKHPRVLEKLRKEVDHLMKGKKQLTYEDLPLLTYAEMVIKETQRIHAVVPLVGKTAIVDTSLGEFHVRKYTRLLVNIQQLHLSETYWTDPLMYNPERWVDGFTPVPGSYLPFGDGPTNCIGQKLAVLEMKIAIAMLVHYFEFKVVEDQDLTEVTSITTGLKRGLMVEIRPRVASF